MSHTRWMRARLAVGAAAISLGLAAVPAVGATSLAAAGQAPRCTQSALQAGLSRGTAKVSHATVGRSFGCRKGWAYAEVNTARFTLTSVFHARDGKWRTVRRGPACQQHAVPKRIYKPACESN